MNIYRPNQTGEMPSDVRPGDRCEVILGNGERMEDDARCFDWSVTDVSEDIVAYRLIGPPYDKGAKYRAKSGSGVSHCRQIVVEHRLSGVHVFAITTCQYCAKHDVVSMHVDAFLRDYVEV